MTSESVLDLVGEGLRVVPLRVFSQIIPRDVLGFCYHSVAEQQSPHQRHLYQCKTSAQFERDLEFLLRHYEIVGYDQIRNGGVRKRGMRPRAIVTFDDGLAECYHTIRPILLKHSIPGLFFVTTEFLDNRVLFYRNKISLCIGAYLQLSRSAAANVRRDLACIIGAQLLCDADVVARLHELTLRDNSAIDGACDMLGVDVSGYLQSVAPYLTTAQVRALASDGFTIGAHGTAHTHVGLLTESDAREEIVTACTTVSDLVGTTGVPFAFPFNGKGVNRDMLRELWEGDPRVGMFFDTHMLARDQEFIINRIVVDRPPRMRRQTTNLPVHLRIAYAREMALAPSDLLRQVSGR